MSIDGGTVGGVPPRGSGSIEVYEWKDGRTVTFRARVRAYGGRHRVDFGTNHQGWSEARARVELERILGQVERGTWKPPVRTVPVVLADEPAADETFHVFASRWWEDKKPTLSPNAQDDYWWRLQHLLGELHAVPIGRVSVRDVDRFRTAKVAERETLEEAARVARKRGKRPPARRPLSNRSINMQLDLLAQILDDAVEYGVLDANPARGRRRRLPAKQSRRTFLEPDMVVDLLEAAGAWERELPEHQHYGRRAFLAALCLAGPRISELTAAPRARLDVTGGRLSVGEAKTEAGVRDIELTFFLQAELRDHLARVHNLHSTGAQVPVFPTRYGGRLNASNVRNRLLAECVRRANAKREADGEILLPAKVTPHALRRTFASIALTAGRDPRFVMAQLGHTDARLTLNVYAQIIQRQRVDHDLVWSLMRFADEPEEWPGTRRARLPEPAPEASRAG